jgi:hypothetical protein
MARLPSLEGEHTNQVDWHRQKLVAISPVLHDRGYRAPITSGLPLQTSAASVGMSQKCQLQAHEPPQHCLIR